MILNWVRWKRRAGCFWGSRFFPDRKADMKGALAVLPRPVFLPRVGSGCLEIEGALEHSAGAAAAKVRVAEQQVRRAWILMTHLCCQTNLRLAS